VVQLENSVANNLTCIDKFSALYLQFALQELNRR